jgi:glycosyltransferase involved in cell wall biosynthesis
MISALVLTRNEEDDLPGCLASLRWCDDVHVFDSQSEDRTVEVARAAGARVSQRRFDHYAAQRNAALAALPFRHPWVLSVDADERIPEALAAEMRAFAASAPEGVAAARIRRRDFYMGRWLRHAQISPYFVRLVRPARVRYEREINEVLVAGGAVATLREPFDHFPFSKGIGHWIARHNRYSAMEAERALAERAQAGAFTWRGALLDPDFNRRRRHQKGLFYRAPARPLLKLAYMMACRRAFLDGWPGVHYALLQAIYEYFIVAKEREIAAARAAAPVRQAEHRPAVPHALTEPGPSKAL